MGTTGSDAERWRERFTAPMVLMTQVARASGTRGLAITNRDAESMQLYAWDVPTGGLRQLTDKPGGFYEGWIAPDGRYVYYLQDTGGSELGHLMRVPFEGGAPEDVTPDMPPYTLRGVGFSGSGNLLVFNPINDDGFYLCCIPVGPGGELGERRVIYRSAQEAWESVASYDGELVGMISTARAGGTRHYSVLAFDVTSGAPIGEVWDGPEASVTTVAFAPVAGDPRLLAATTRSGYVRPLIWNPRTGERRDIPLDTFDGDIYPLDWSADATRILLCQMQRGDQQLFVYDLATAALIRLPHPSGTYFMPGFGGTYFGPAGEIFALWDDSTHPLRLVALDPQTGAVRREVLTAGVVPPGHAWQSVTFPSSDGQEVQGWLGMPAGTGPFPAIIEMHGGPHIAVSNQFSPFSQAWIDRGFAYLTINYRGSTTFGWAFQEQIWGDVGHWELEDMAAARAWLVGEGLARPDAIFLYGASYGGFLTLLGLGRQPTLWVGGLALVAIADCAANYEDASEALRGAMRAWFRGTPQEQPDLYRRASPITYLADLVAPALIIQGRNDSRATARQMERYEAQARALGKPVTVEWFDAGHGMSETQQMIRFQERFMDFAGEVLSRRTASTSS